MSGVPEQGCRDGTMIVDEVKRFTLHFPVCVCVCLTAVFFHTHFPLPGPLSASPPLLTPTPGQQWQLPSLSSASEVQEPNRERGWKGERDPWNLIHDGEGLRWLWCPPCCDDGLYVIGTDRICLRLQICRRVCISLGAWIDGSWREVLMGYRVSKHFLRLMVSVSLGTNHLRGFPGNCCVITEVTVQEPWRIPKQNTINNMDKWTWCANRPKSLQYMKDIYSVLQGDVMVLKDLMAMVES